MASTDEVVSMDGGELGGELGEDGGEWTVVGEGETGGGRDGFFSAVNVWIHRPHVVNKRVSCAVVNIGDTGERGEGVVRLEREIIPKSSGHDIGNDTVLIGEWEGPVWWVWPTWRTFWVEAKFYTFPVTCTYTCTCFIIIYYYFN